ncbi:hypothetical protein K432DRAFT_286366 [Lepidopterella palustris CBS 459.81]|uniref:Integral membrane protein n=1 Tax=Lepidopterella palustris CBS 459.81 TaxID=1314670 RepID=A0A8E2JKF4_9PEZI|nr:hypothetical protein K432DRAFT_286366 [Lepidopterella palustris CBS 459.81]
MGSNDIPPPHVPSYYLPISNALMKAGGVFWTIAYILYVRSSFRTQSYGMPLLSMALNFAWEVIYALVVCETFLERLIFSIWLLIDFGLVYSLVVWGVHEWAHSPFVAKHLGKIWAGMVVGAIVGHWSFAKWWIENDIGQKEGKIYQGRVGPDTTELGWWSAVLVQAYLSAASLAMLVVRGHSGGTGWGIWLTRTLGTIIGLLLYYGWGWYHWREAHAYFINPFAIFLWMTGLVSDLVYPFVLWQVRKTEKVLPNGRRVRGDDFFQDTKKDK